MVLKLEKETYIAHFTHVRTADRLWEVTTLCTIHVAPCATSKRPCETLTAVTGIARCSRKDNFEKAKGRKLAFTRAISHLPRDTRRQLWVAYLQPQQVAA